MRRGGGFACLEGSTLVRGRLAPLDTLALLVLDSTATGLADETLDVEKVTSRRRLWSPSNPFAR